MNTREEMILKIKESENAVNIMDPNFKIDGVCYKLGDEEVKCVDISGGDMTGFVTFLGLLKNPDVLKISYNAGHVKAALEQWIIGQPLDKIEWYSIKDKSEELGLPANLNDLCDSLEVERGEKAPETIEDCVEALEEELEVYNLIKGCKTKEDIKNVTIKKVEARPLEKYFTKNKQGLIVRVKDSLIAEDVLKNNDIIVWGGIPFIYHNNAYVMDKAGNSIGSKLRAVIREYLDETVKNQTAIKRIYSYIMDTPSIHKASDELNNYPKHWICFKNCMWDVKNWRAYPPDPKYFAINQIPYNFTGEEIRGEGTVTEEFLTDLIPAADDREMLKQYMGYCLTTDTSLQKYLVLKGAGGIGKSVVLEILENMVGTDNLINNSLEKLSDRFTTVELANKLLNSCGDISSKALDDISLIKQLIGEDRIKGELKHGAHVYFKNYCKLIFSANQIPISLDEKSDAWYRRFLILKINKKAKEIENLKERLMQEREVSYTLYECIRALQRMYKNGGKIIESEQSKKEVLDMYKNADTVKAFLSDVTDINPSAKMERALLFKYYQSYCLKEERTPLSRNSFYTNLRTKGYQEIKTNGDWYFVGFTIKSGVVLKECNNVSVFPKKAQ